MVAVMITSISSTAAFASRDSCSFAYDGKSGYGELSVSWNLTYADRGTAETTYASSDYYAASYIEAEDGGKVVDSDYDYGTDDARAKVVQSGVNRFNSTHVVVSYSNHNKWLESETCTDW